MFTGIVQHLGVVRSVEGVPFGVRLTVDLAGWSHAPDPGESIAVNGCCLTVAEVGDAWVRFDVIQQTLTQTTLGGLGAGDRINLEHAVTPSTLLGGHIVQGHVDGVAIARRVEDSDREWRVGFEPPAALMAYIVDRGSVAVDGVSLTVAAVHATTFEVALIPTTLELTTLGGLAPGVPVNLETDYIAKTVVSWLERSRGGS